MMVKQFFKYTFSGVFYLLLFISCSAQSVNTSVKTTETKSNSVSKQTSVFKHSNKGQIYTGADVLSNDYGKYASLFTGKTVGVVTNQTGVIPTKNKKHVVDFLIEKGVRVKRIFAPEHGFRGKADAGETVKDGIDTKTGLPIVSLYGKNKKPYPSQINDLDIIVFDIQDVGARFYTYISTLHYVMEAAAENGKKVIVLDRPNPNGHYIDGPVLEKAYKSFVGMHPVPIVYGMTIGEYGKMINGERWLKNGIVCDYTVVKLQNYNHKKSYDLPVLPSPNLPNAKAINLYPSTCFFEGTKASEGRGTSKQFQVYGSPYLKNMSYTFTPRPNNGAKNPKLNGKLCYGEDLSNTPRLSKISLEWIIKAYKNNTQFPFWVKNGDSFWLDKLAGTSSLRKQIEQGLSESQIKATWQKGLSAFKLKRAQYLMYP